MAWGEGSATFGISGTGTGGEAALTTDVLGLFGVGFLGVGFTGLAVWYGLETSGFLGGVTSLISSVMKFAAFVGAGFGGRVFAFEPEVWGRESHWPQAWRRGEGILGAVGLEVRLPVRKRGAVAAGVFCAEMPFGREAGVPFVDGNIDRCAWEGAGVWLGASAGADPFTGFWGDTAGNGTFCSEEDSASSPTRRRFVSVFTGDNLRAGGGERVPKDGEWYLFLGRALPPPCHRYTPLGFFERVRLCPSPLGVLGDAPGVPGVKIGELPRTGVRDGLVEKRNGSGLSLVAGQVSIRQVGTLVCGQEWDAPWTFFSRNVIRPLVSHSLSVWPSFSFKNWRTLSILSAGDRFASFGGEPDVTRGGVEKIVLVFVWLLEDDCLTRQKWI